MTAPRRKLWLDWQRGLAVLFMVEVHVLDAWLAPAAAHGHGFGALRMLGGLAAPGFLYMAGLSQALGDAALERKGVAPGARRSAALRRALWLLGVAYGFRAAEYLLGYAPALWHGWWDTAWAGVGDVLKVDILNVIAVGLGLSALLTIGVPRRLGPALAALAAVAVVLATPGVAGTAHAPSRLLDYAYIASADLGRRGNFHLFNWVAFLLAGAALAPLARGPDRPLLWLALGAALLGAGLGLDARAPLRGDAFWRASPAWFAMRLGACVALTGLTQLVPLVAERALRWLTVLGRQSLVGYIASVELTYGGLARPLRGRLPFPATIAAIVAMVGVTWAISVAWERLQARRRARPRPAAPAPA
ncbi:conserved hypothetical protein [Anaeromyxobacter dehalogenans 2CP-1]|uniref:Heparan-alpha-glucosaminide N-acetyltransferase catalytic domain-containing protein n=1 Tax=Anaeromyxobacter dehalogenans (strain ATCC BAA-258 / DSM 21875 / 2CP-1) TaxID=455488 RepID=B8JDZ4_ANAD2|nr:heparan-alpha-glucosaminide N-acetyltransferase domain-containing protein [Anaeromyxobacter dehalogenans]ACL66059.1 conserved hypothetical protein [Anaeromyxobacter dehalogenans 2CP-1]